MKDAKGHGSEAGLHSAGIQSLAIKGKLQRRHFEAIAAELKSAPDAGSPAHAQRVQDMANQLATTNPGFRRDFFVAAATGGTHVSDRSGKSIAYSNKSQGRNSGMSKAKKIITGMRGG